MVADSDIRNILFVNISIFQYFTNTKSEQMYKKSIFFKFNLFITFAAMKIYVSFLSFLFVIGVQTLFGQYLANPSFEGIPTHYTPPPPWGVCDSESTPDTQPGWWGSYGPASDGNTYLGMITRGSGVLNAFTWEDVHVSFVTPLSPDTCYMFSIDLRFDPNTGFNNISLNNPVTLKIYGEENVCDKEHLLWESGSITDLDWVTHTFLVQPQFEITELVMEVYYLQMPEYFGHMLIDNIVIEPTPVMDLGNDTTVTFCPGGYFPISPGSEFNSYLWQDGYTDSVYQVTESGQYWVNVTDGYGCSASDSIDIVVAPYEEMTTQLLDEISICEGQNVNVEVDVEGGIEEYSYLWTPGEESDTLNTNILMPDTTTLFYVTVTDACDNTVQDSVLIDVIPSPDIDLGNDTVICDGEEFVLDAGDGFIYYQWSTGSNEQSITVSEEGIYWVQVNGEGGCSSFDQIEVSFSPSIAIDLGNDTSICVGTTLFLEAPSGMQSYLWQDGSTESTYEVNESGTYWVNVENAAGCMASDTIQVLFEDETTVDLGEDQTLCAGEKLVLDPGFYSQYQWQDGSTGQTYTVTQAGTYAVNVLGSCGWNSDTIVVTYHPPVLPDLGPDTTICYDDSYTLNPGLFTNIIWQDGSIQNTYPVYETGIYSVTVTALTYSCTGSDTVFVRVGQLVELGADTSFCHGDTIVLSSSNDFDYFEWTKDNNTDILSTTNTLPVYEEGTYTITVGLDDIDCTSSDDVYVEEHAIATADLPEGKICEGDTLILEVDEDPTFSYYWNDQEGNNRLSVSESGVYWIEVGNDCGYAYDTTEIIVLPLPDIDLGDDQFLFDEDGEIILDAGENYVSYIWQDGSSQTTYTVTYEQAINRRDYFVKVFDGNCYATDSIIIETGIPEIPVLLTPNGDGYNDVFKPGFRWGAIKEHTIVVFNRWGEKVWESTDFPGGWKGEDIFGNKVSDGTYYWVLEAYYGRGIKHIYKGSLTVLGNK
jgi:gliding motility-associated-like protein